MPKMTYSEESIPLKVREMARASGVHDACMFGEPEDACATCHTQIMLALDYHYGHLKTAEAVLMAYLDDYLLERKNHD